MAWKRPGDKAAAGGDLFVRDAFYNLLCPQRPHLTAAWSKGPTALERRSPLVTNLCVSAVVPAYLEPQTL